MSHGTNNSAALEDDEQFMVYNRREVAGILRDLAKQRDMLSAVFHHGKDMVLTAVVDIDFDSDAVYLDYGPDEDSNRNLLSSERTIFVTVAGGVKVQWLSSSISSVKFKGSDAFKIAIPEKLQRVQRREFYRLPTPIAKPLICKIPVSADKLLEVPLVDISTGGIGVILPDPPDPAIVKGAEFQRCTLDFPEFGTAELVLRVHGVWAVTLKNDSTSQRAGLAFVNPRAGTQSLIQRYMIKLERERIANTD
jgi:c-di-GMP-binding flagellar brake protein YcgR